MAEQLAQRLTLGVVASIVMALGLLLMKSRAEELPTAHGSRILKAIIQWTRDPLWLAGLGLQAAGFAIYLFALAGAPVSMLAVMMEGGVAVFVIFATLFLHERASPREWIGIGGVIAAMLLLSLSLGNEDLSGSFNATNLAMLSAVAAGAALAPHFNRALRGDGLAAAISAGIAFGLGSLYAKPMTSVFANASGLGLVALAQSPWIYLTLAANLAGVVLLQNSFHDARGMIAMPLASALSNFVPILGGMMALGESLPSSRGAAAMRLAAFALTILSGGFLAVADQTDRDSLAAQAALH